MKIKELIDMILEAQPDTSKEIHISDDVEFDDGFGGTCKGHAFSIKKAERFSGDVYLVFHDWREDKENEE